MKNPLVDDLNELGFVWRGEEVDVVGVSFFKEKTEKTELSEGGRPITYTTSTKMVEIKLANGEEVEMEFDHVRQMIKRAERRR